jgi:flagellar biosynthesis protein FliR
MTLTVEASYITSVLLVTIRLAALLLLTPLFAAAKVPNRVRVLLLIALALVLVSSMKVAPVEVPTNVAGLVQAALQEALLGALLAFGLFTAFGAFLFGGRILDFQMGFGVANLIDPVTNTQSPLIGSVLNLMAVVTFFLLNGHHLMIRGLAFSLEKIPPGSALVKMDISAIAAQFGLMFVFGVTLMAPAIITLLLLDVGMAFMARTMPQVNIFIVGLPLKIFVGLSVLALSLNYFGPLLNRVFESIFRYWQAIINH